MTDLSDLIERVQASICSALLEAFPMADKIADNYAAVAAKAALSAIEQEQEPVAHIDARLQELHEIADGAWGNGPLKRGAAMAEIKRLSTLSPSVCEGKVTEEKRAPKTWPYKASQIALEQAWASNRERQAEIDHLRNALNAAAEEFALIEMRIRDKQPERALGAAMCGQKDARTALTAALSQEGE